MIAAGDKIVIEPVGDALWLAVHGRIGGKILPEEVEEESVLGQERIYGRWQQAAA